VNHPNYQRSRPNSQAMMRRLIGCLMVNFRALMNLRGFVNVRVSMHPSTMPVKVHVHLTAAKQFPQRLTSQNDQHQRDAEFEAPAQAFANLKMKKKNCDRGNKQ
jgi:hypothetical protein